MKKTLLDSCRQRSTIAQLAASQMAKTLRIESKKAKCNDDKLIKYFQLTSADRRKLWSNHKKS